MKAILLVPLALALAFLASCGNEGTNDGVGGEGGRGASSPSTGGGAGETGTGASDPCCVLGAICHVTGGADDLAIDECHVLGHENVRSACEKDYDRCYALCMGATHDPEPHACQ